ncbi:MAG: hypothetical protein AAF789_14925 [Bacteroidota bacterium]
MPTETVSPTTTFKGTIVRVQDAASEKAFFQLPEKIYAQDPKWIRPLMKDVKGIFDPHTNPFFKHGSLEKWILKDEKGETVGRVAAFIDEEKAYTYRQPTGGMGFFECVNNQEAAFMLFDTAKEWLEERKMGAMDGPINFGERSQFWGLMISEEDNFYTPYQHSYNPSYYQAFFEAYGFQVYFEQYFFRYYMAQRLPRQYPMLSERIVKNSPHTFTFENVSFKNREKYLNDFLTIYNEAWKTHDNFKEMAKEQIAAIFKAIEPIVDETAIWFAYADGEPAMFFLMIPEINEIFRLINTGKMRLIDKLRFAWLRYRGKSRRLVVLGFGIKPEYQKKGIEAVMMTQMQDFFTEQNRYDEVLGAWIGDFNPKMINMMKKVDAKVVRTSYTYRKLFDPEATFERCPILD